MQYHINNVISHGVYMPKRIINEVGKCNKGAVGKFSRIFEIIVGKYGTETLPIPDKMVPCNGRCVVVDELVWQAIKIGGYRECHNYRDCNAMEIDFVLMCLVHKICELSFKKRTAVLSRVF